MDLPIETPTLLAFAAASLAVYLAPGADMAYIASSSMNHGRRAGLWAAAGTVTGVTMQALAAAFGVTLIFQASPILFEVVRWLGVAYLCYLGVRMLRSRGLEGMRTAAVSWRPAAVWMRGTAINLLNPKISLFFLAFLPQFTDPAAGDVFLQLAILGALFSAGSVLWCSAQALIFAGIGTLIAGSETAQRWQRRITGGALIGFAGLLAFSGLRR